MSTREPVIYVLEPFGGSSRRHNVALPLLYWDDAAVTRGEGVFESLLVRDGQARNVGRHFKRFRSSAQLLDLPEPEREQWEEATARAAEEYGAGEGKCVWTYTRGRSSTERPTAWLSISPLSEQVLRQRAEGVKVMTAPRQVATAEGQEPWQLIGAKTLNYAATMALLRHAQARGFDDVIYVEQDTGLVLEGATSTVITVRKDHKLRTPTIAGKTLPGTTQAALFEYAEKHGWRCKEKDISIERLLDAESVWLLSSVRGPVRVTALNEHELPAPKDEKQIRQLLAQALG